MTTAIDTNVIIALWHKNPSLSSLAQKALETAFNRGTLVIAAPVFAELLAAPGRTEAFVDSFLEDTAIAVDWGIEIVKIVVLKKRHGTWLSSRAWHRRVGRHRIGVAYHRRAGSDVILRHTRAGHKQRHNK